jgi:hypothetical protein
MNSNNVREGPAKAEEPKAMRATRRISRLSNAPLSAVVDLPPSSLVYSRTLRLRRQPAGLFGARVFAHLLPFEGNFGRVAHHIYME